ncbi:MAG: hypothetical protein FJ041_03375 [Candidatus Cloacimonetes bacterium]|nr:hypothetical protein [Candidatus Cloacimonadota bacterium]
MITIDWKERLTKDALYYLEKKLPKQDYDFEIIYNWYPERVNGRIPGEVIQLIVKVLAHKINKQHEQYIPFYQHLWDKKGENGKLAFICFMARFFPKNQALYLPIIEKAMQKATAHDIGAILEKVFFPLYKKQTNPYLAMAYPWLESSYEPLRKQATNYLIKMIKLRPEVIPTILKHMQNRWGYAKEEIVPVNIAILKAIRKINPEAVMEIFREYKITRDPQTVEILCGSISDYDAELVPVVENWTHSGNARLKKAATSAYKILLKKKA